MEHRANIYRVPLACCAILLIVLGLSESAACDELPPESFLKAAAYLERLKTYQATVTVTDHLKNERGSTRHEHDGDRALRSFENRDGSTDVSARNEKYSFRVIRPAKGDKWSLIDVSKPHQPKQVTPLSRIASPSHIGVRLGFAGQSVWEALKLGHLDIVSVVAHSDEPESDVTVKLVRSETAPRDFRLASGTFVFSPQNHWLIRSADMSEAFADGGSGVVRFEHEFSFSKPLGVVVVASQTINGVFIHADATKPPVVLNLEYENAYDTLNKDRPDRFELRRFGLPEPK